MPARYTDNEPSCGSKMLNGAVVGAGLGCTFGGVLGLLSNILYARRAKKQGQTVPMRTIINDSGRAAVTAGAAFGFFLAIGTMIRCLEPTTGESEAQMASSWQRHNNRMIWTARSGLVASRPSLSSSSSPLPRLD
ncbi:Reactive oxygen species modulator 1 [Balamuthia mandrillaris]